MKKYVPKLFALVLVALLASLVANGVGSELSTRLTFRPLAEIPDEGREVVEPVLDISKNITSEKPSIPGDIVAFVGIPEGAVCPIAQASPGDPDYYLGADVEGSGVTGTPFIDSECTLESPIVYIYGHHMNDGTSFAPLANYVYTTHQEAYPTIMFEIRDKERFDLRVVAVDILNADIEKLVIDQSERFDDVIADCDYVLGNVATAKQLFAFCTCSYQTANSRTIVYAVRE